MNQEVIYQKKYQLKITVGGRGEALLFLHGWPTNACLWQYQQDLFKSQYKVITPEWLGFGQSEKPADHHYSFASMKNMLDAIIRQTLEPEEKVTIVAHDIGGPPSLLWASEHPERVRKLIMLNTLFYPFQTPMDKLGHFIFGLPIINRLQMSNYGLKNLMRNLIKNKTPGTRKAVETILHRHQSWSHQLRLKTILEPVESEGREVLNSLASTFSALPLEKHLIIALEDPLCYAHMRRIHEACPSIPAHYLEKCGHFISIDRPKELNDILEKIISKADTEPSVSTNLID